VPQSAAAVHRAIRALADPVRAKHSLRFFKTGPGQYGEGDRFLGLTVPQLRALAREYKDLPISEATNLLQSPWHEERALTLLILGHQYARGTAAARAAIYRLYLKHTKRVNNWDLVDCSAEHIVGAHLATGDRSRLARLARSADLWERRIAIVATFHYIKRGEFGETLKIARLLLDDEHDLIHKAVGWMLREVGKRDRAALEGFLTRNAARMPRTMLRYAIERFPAAERQKWLRTPAARSARTDRRGQAP
jgi:3-methyladenine DNA glycosylase AlkD